jgi:hypothetical protein
LCFKRDLTVISVVVSPTPKFNPQDIHTSTRFWSAFGTLKLPLEELDIRLISPEILEMKSSGPIVALKTLSRLSVAIGTYHNEDLDDMNTVWTSLHEGFFPALRHLKLYRYSYPPFNNKPLNETPTLSLLAHNFGLGELCATLGVELEYV